MRIFFFLLICFTSSCYSQSDSLEDAKKFQEHLNEEFLNEKTSPLEEQDLKEFKGLDFFKISDKYIVEAVFKRTEGQLPFVMPTTSTSKPIYVKYGEVTFSIEETEFTLSVYQNQRLVTNPAYKDYLFIPFTDLTNGESTYGGGRYLDFKIPTSSQVILDFNKSYNPYCAYNGAYSCPIPPEENNLPIKIEAGVKQFKLYSEEDVTRSSSVK